MSQVINDRKMYIAGRQKNPAEPLHGGNVEYYGGYSDNRESVTALVEDLNAGRRC
jgi:hypothetical protein